MAAVDDLLLPWQVDLVLRHEMPPELESPCRQPGVALLLPGPIGAGHAGGGDSIMRSSLAKQDAITQLAWVVGSDL